MQPTTQPDPPADSPPEDHRKALALGLLCRGATIPEAARELGVDRSTVWRWARAPEFAAQLRACAADRLEDAVIRLDEAARSAIDILASLAEDEHQAAAIRVRAADSLLGRASFVQKASKELERLHLRWAQADPNQPLPEDLAVMLARDIANDAGLARAVLQAILASAEGREAIRTHLNPNAAGETADDK